MKKWQTQENGRMTRRNFLRLTGVGLLSAAGLVSGFSQNLRARSNELNIYSDTEAANMEKALRGFEEDTGLKPKVLRMSTGPARRKIEAESKNPICDIWWGALAIGGIRANKAGVLQPVVTENTKKIPSKFKSDNNTWYGWGFWGNTISINTDRAEELGLDIPESYLHLADPQYKGEISAPNPNQSGSGLMYVLSWVQLYGETMAFEFMKELDKNVAVYTESSSVCSRHAAKGRAAIGLGWDELTLRLKDKGFPVDWVRIREGYPYSLDIVSVIKGAPHPENAKIALNWALSKKAMKNYSEFRTGTSREDIPTEELRVPDYMKPFLDEVQWMDYDIKQAAEIGDRILDKWLELFG